MWEVGIIQAGACILAFRLYKNNNNNHNNNNNNYGFVFTRKKKIASLIQPREKE